MFHIAHKLMFRGYERGFERLCGEEKGDYSSIMSKYMRRV